MADAAQVGTKAGPSAPAQAEAPLRTGTHALRHMLARQDFRRLFGARLAAQWADGIFQASLAGAVLFNPQHAANPGDLAASFAILLLPYSFIGPFAGVLLDRNSRTKLMVWSNVVRAIVVLSVAVLVFSGYQGIGFFALALVALSVSRFFLSALSASLPHVVDRPELVSANALTTTLGTAMAAVGGLTALGVRMVAGTGNHGYGAVSASSAVGYVLAAWAISHFKAGALGPSTADRQIHTSAREIAVGMWQGAVHIVRKPPAAAVLTAMSVHRFLFGTLTVSVLLLFRQYVEPAGFIRSGIAGVGQALGAGAIGALVAASVTPVLVRRFGKPAWAAAALALGGGLGMALFIPFVPWMFLLGGFVIGFAGQAAKVCADTIVQETMEESFRGRVFSVYDTLFNVTFVLGIVVGAYVLPPDGRSVSVFVTGAVLYVLVGVVYRVIAVRSHFPR